MSYTLRKALAGIDLFAGLSESTLEELVQAGTTFTTNPGRHVVEQGATDAGLQVVLDGTAEVLVNGVARPPLHPGDYFGEISMIDGAARSATVISGPEGLKTFVLSTLAFAPMMQNPEVASTLLKALCARIRSLEAPPPEEVEAARP
jgi:CRP/FNR family cyclic AMP-dependent transcriptional regulator